MRQLCASDALPALRSVDAAGLDGATPRELVRCLDAGSGGVLTRLTALDLSRVPVQGGDAGVVRTLFSRLTGLRSLSLVDARLGSPGLGALADAVPQMAALPALDISGMISTGALGRQGARR